MSPWAEREAVRLLDAGVLDPEVIEAAYSDKTDHRFVYLCQSGDLFKIGYTRNPKARVADMNTGSALPVILLHVIPTSEYIYLEQHLHERFRAKRKRGEWFALDAQDVAAFRAAHRIPAAIR